MPYTESLPAVMRYVKININLRRSLMACSATGARGRSWPSCLPGTSLGDGSVSFSLHGRFLDFLLYLVARCLGCSVLQCSTAVGSPFQNPRAHENSSRVRCGDSDIRCMLHARKTATFCVSWTHLFPRQRYIAPGSDRTLGPLHFHIETRKKIKKHTAGNSQKERKTREGENQPDFGPQTAACRPTSRTRSPLRSKGLPLRRICAPGESPGPCQEEKRREKKGREYEIRELPHRVRRRGFDKGTRGEGGGGYSRSPCLSGLTIVRVEWGWGC